MKSFIRMMNDESGAAAAEYALILAIVGAAIAAAAIGLGQAVSNSMGNATNCINNPPTTSTGSCGTTAS